MNRLIIIQTTAPDYRKNFFQYLSKKLEDRFELYAGKEYFEASVKTDQKIDHKPLKNYFLLKRKFLWQTGLWHLLLSNDVLVMEMNPRIINNWIFLFIRKFLGKKNVLWGHAWPRGGKNSRSDMVRNWMRKLADAIIVYTRQQQKELQEKMPEKIIKAAPNALYFKNMMQPVAYTGTKNLIYVGRLTPMKKTFFLVRAFHHAIKEIPKETNLFIIGSGEEYESIKKYIDENQLSNRIQLLGHISDYQQLKELYAQSIFSVIPGYAGLSVTQSLGFGIPLLVSKNENHSPEIEAVIEGENALFFETDSIKDFIEKLKSIYQQTELWNSKREKISLFCKKNYSVEAMAEPFINLILK